MDLGLQGKVALVAGASMGIGYGAALALSREGARVVIGARNRERLDAAAARITEATGNPVGTVVLDVLDPDAGDRFVRAALDSFGSPAILVTNGGGPTGGSFETLTREAFEEAARLSFLSVVSLTQAALPHMRTAGWGRLVHISSATVLEPSADLFLSSSVRPAVAGFSKALSREVAAQGITTNLICPGYVETEALVELAARRGRDAGTTTEHELDVMRASVPAGRLAAPEELGNVVAFLCGDQAGYITGTAIRVDGGKVFYML